MTVLTPSSDLIELLPLRDANDLERFIWFNWPAWARPDQLVPDDDDWDLLVWLAGRGGGKTRSGAQETNKRARGGGRDYVIALVGRTAKDVRDVMIYGESGTMACSPPWFRPAHFPSKRMLLWPNGARGFTYSADAPDDTPCPQHHFGWGDEFAAWQKAEALSKLQDGLRLGLRPKLILTTTPRRWTAATFPNGGITYKVRVKDAEGGWVFLDDAAGHLACVGYDCKWPMPNPLAPGEYSWQVEEGPPGPTTPFMAFTVLACGSEAGRLRVISTETGVRTSCARSAGRLSSAWARRRVSRRLPCGSIASSAGLAWPTSTATAKPTWSSGRTLRIRERTASRSRRVAPSALRPFGEFRR